jgi:hypothetical protein
MSNVLHFDPASPAPQLERARNDLDSKGYCIIENVLSRGEIAALKSRLIGRPGRTGAWRRIP